MDYEDLVETLIERYREHCDYIEAPYVEEDEKFFIKIATHTIQNMMSGGLELDEAYEMYLEQIDDDLSYVTKAVDE